MHCSSSFQAAGVPSPRSAMPSPSWTKSQRKHTDPQPQVERRGSRERIHSAPIIIRVNRTSPQDAEPTNEQFEDAIDDLDACHDGGVPGGKHTSDASGGRSDGEKDLPHDVSNSPASPDTEELNHQLRIVALAVEELSRSVHSRRPRQVKDADHYDASRHNGAPQMDRHEAGLLLLGQGVGLGLFDADAVEPRAHLQQQIKRNAPSRRSVALLCPGSPVLSPLLGVSRRHWDTSSTSSSTAPAPRMTSTKCSTSIASRANTSSCLSTSTTPPRKTKEQQAQTSCSTTPTSSPTATHTWDSIGATIAEGTGAASPALSDANKTPPFGSPVIPQKTDSTEAPSLQPFYSQPEMDSPHIHNDPASVGTVIAASLVGSLILLATLLWALFRQRRRVQRRKHLARVLDRVGHAGSDGGGIGRVSEGSSEAFTSFKDSFDQEKFSTDVPSLNTTLLKPIKEFDDPRLAVRMSRDLASSGIVAETLAAHRDTTFSWQHPTLSVPPAAARSFGSGHYVKKRSTLPAKTRIAVPPFLPTTQNPPLTWLPSAGDVACVQSEAILGTEDTARLDEARHVLADAANVQPANFPRCSESIYSVDLGTADSLSDAVSLPRTATAVVQSSTGHTLDDVLAAETSIGDTTITATSTSDISEGQVCMVTATGRRSSLVTKGSTSTLSAPLPKLSPPAMKPAGTEFERSGEEKSNKVAASTDDEVDMKSMHPCAQWLPHPFTSFQNISGDDLVSDDDATTGYDAGGETDTDHPFEQCKPLFSPGGCAVGAFKREATNGDEVVDLKRSSRSPLTVPCITLTMDDEADGTIQRPLSLDSTELSSSDSMNSDTVDFTAFPAGYPAAWAHSAPYKHTEAAKSTVFLRQFGSSFEIDDGSASGEDTDTDTAVCHKILRSECMPQTSSMSSFGPSPSSVAAAATADAAGNAHNKHCSPLQHAWTQDLEVEDMFVQEESAEECLEWDDFPTLPPWNPVQR